MSFNRYVSAPEALWRLSEYNLHGRSHAVHRLPVHLSDEQNRKKFTSIGFFKQNFVLSKAYFSTHFLPRWQHLAALLFILSQRASFEH